MSEVRQRRQNQETNQPLVTPRMGRQNISCFIPFVTRANCKLPTAYQQWAVIEICIADTSHEYAHEASGWHETRQDMLDSIVHLKASAGEQREVATRGAQTDCC